MSRIPRIILICLLVLALEPAHVSVSAQNPAFEVATIRPSKEAVKFERDGETQLLGDTLRMRDVTVNTCIKLAYHVQDRQIAGPSWLASERFDITAKTDGPADEDTVKLMVRSLLANRFGLSFHRESREMKVIILTVANGGAKLAPTATPDAKPYHQNSANGTIATSMPMAEFADFISAPLDTPVVDHTGLKGKYDFTIDFTPYLPDPGKNMDPGRPDATALLKAVLNDELGLRMEGGKASLDVLVVDHIEKPSEN